MSFADYMRAPRRSRSWTAPSQMRNALVALFETAVIQSDTTARTVLSKVLCNPGITFDKPLLDFTSNRHLEALTRPGTPSCVWETQAHKAGNTRTVLDPIIHGGHEHVIDFIGTP